MIALSHNRNTKVFKKLESHHSKAYSFRTGLINYPILYLDYKYFH